MRKTANDSITLQQRPANFLLTYRTTPHATTNAAPCELLMNRVLHTHFDMLRPSTEKRVCDSQKQQHDEHGKDLSLGPGQTVWARDFRGSTKWLPGVVVQCTGPLIYMIQLNDKSLWKRHIDYLQNRVESQASVNTPAVTDIPESSVMPFLPLPSLTELSSSSEENSESLPPSQQQNNGIPNPPVSVPRRNPPRNRHPPQRFQSGQI